VTRRGARKGAPNPMADQLIKVLRAFYVRGAVKQVDDVFAVDAKFAAELRSLRKAEYTVATPTTKPAAKAAPNKDSSSC